MTSKLGHRRKAPREQERDRLAELLPTRPLSTTQWYAVETLPCKTEDDLLWSRAQLHTQVIHLRPTSAPLLNGWLEQLHARYQHVQHVLLREPSARPRAASHRDDDAEVQPPPAKRQKTEHDDDPDRKQLWMDLGMLRPTTEYTVGRRLQAISDEVTQRHTVREHVGRTCMDRHFDDDTGEWRGVCTRNCWRTYRERIGAVPCRAVSDHQVCAVETYHDDHGTKRFPIGWVDAPHGPLTRQILVPSPTQRDVDTIELLVYGDGCIFRRPYQRHRHAMLETYGVRYAPSTDMTRVFTSPGARRLA